MNLSKSEKIAGIVAAALLFVVTLVSAFFFLGKLKVSVVEWLAFNACAVTSYVYLGCFVAFLISKNGGLLVFTSLPLFFLGTISMFVLPWSGAYLIAHITHIIITANITWAFYIVLKYKAYKGIAIGLMIGMLVFVPYIAYVQTYNQTHAAELSRLLQQQ
ncbi:MAG TPA: hypothetical protein VHO72_07900 [Bacteroidales bacterium]|nr:hypothetical protein [Bacteroidales bacterium]